MNKSLPIGIKELLCLLLISIYPAFVIAQNDACNITSAPLLTIGTTCTNTSYTISSSFTDSGPAPCNGTSVRDGWYRFTTGPNDTRITINGTSNRQMGLAVYTSCTGTAVACTVPSAANAELTTNVTPNTTYLLRILRSSSGSNNMTGTICITSVPALAGDECTTAISQTISTTCNYQTFSLSGMTPSSTTPAPGCASFSGGDMWFKFTVPANGNFTVTTDTGTLTDGGMALYKGTCTGLTLLQCDDDTGPGLMPEISINGETPGSTMFVRFWSYGGNSQGNFKICIREDARYCVSTSTGQSSYYISEFNTSGGLSDISNMGSGISPNGYGDFTALSLSTIPGSTINFNANFSGTSNTYGFRIWVDWNDNGQFEASEILYSTSSYTTNVSSSFTIPATATLGTYRMRIRANYLSVQPDPCGNISYGETEDYTLTIASLPPCPSFVTNLNANITSSSTATITFSPPAVIPSAGYHYYLSSSQVSPLTTTTPTGTVPNTENSLNLSGLALGQSYYVWIRTNCGGTDGTGFWIGPILIRMPHCNVGNSQGTTSTACPAVISGGLGLNGTDPEPIACGGTGCTTLEASYLKLGETSQYRIESIPFSPPYQFNCLKNPVSVNVDDVWSPLVQLPFNFCFFGQNYNNCVISSNGVVSFDTQKYTPGSHSDWEIEENIPSTNHFTNSIFGVYHDIEPSLGGEVGWELITLNTGCRALVAAWSDIPYYSSSCNTLRYSGMIVFYENTNIIEVYIKNKPVCSTWNDGNAILGLMNQAGTVAYVPPGHNALDTDWAAYDEAWRFIPNGPSITSIKWFEGTDTTGTPIGTTDEITVCPTDDTIYTAQVTYTLCNTSALIETDQTQVLLMRNKEWTGAQNNLWHNPNNWTPAGVPTASNCITIPASPNPCVIQTASGTAEVYNVMIENGGILRMDPQSKFLTQATVNIQNGGTFEILDSANLLQVQNIPNQGTARIQRFTKPMYRYDYTYWNSPVTLASNFTLGNLSPETQPDKYFSWTPSIASAAGNWKPETTATVMNPTRGYIVRAPQSYSTDPATRTIYEANFYGTPNNGLVTVPISGGSMGANSTDDKWNLIGNPYPSALSAQAFLMHPSNTNSIDGTIYLWTHNSPPSAAYPDPFYGDFSVNYTDTDYASWNLLGGVGTIASTGGARPNGLIASAQSFFVLSKVSSGNVQFQNTMRNAGDNTQFFRMSDAIEADNSVTKHRLWLNLYGPQNRFNQILVGYAEGATLGYDRAWDGLKNEGNTFSFYSLLDTSPLVIQARPLPFDQEDRVPLGFHSPVAGNFRIGIDSFDPFFENRSIYLEDLVLGITHDLTLTPYYFHSEAGRYNERFQLRYGQSALGIATQENHNDLLYLQDDQLIYQGNGTLSVLRLFDMTGKLITELKPGINAQQTWTVQLAQAAYIGQLEYKDGSVRAVKLIKL